MILFASTSTGYYHNISSVCILDQMEQYGSHAGLMAGSIKQTRSNTVIVLFHAASIKDWCQSIKFLPLQSPHRQIGLAAIRYSELSQHDDCIIVIIIIDQFVNCSNHDYLTFQHCSHAARPGRQNGAHTLPEEVLGIHPIFRNVQH